MAPEFFSIGKYYVFYNMYNGYYCYFFDYNERNTVVMGTGIPCWLKTSSLWVRLPPAVPILSVWWNGRHTRLKIWRLKKRGGSTPPIDTKNHLHSLFFDI